MLPLMTHRRAAARIAWCWTTNTSCAHHQQSQVMHFMFIYCPKKNAEEIGVPLITRQDLVTIFMIMMMMTNLWRWCGGNFSFSSWWEKQLSLLLKTIHYSRPSGPRRLHTAHDDDDEETWKFIFLASFANVASAASLSLSLRSLIL